MIAWMPVSLFDNKPECCPFGHELWPGKARVSWKPCICAPAREAAERGRGMGHVMVTCNACHDQFREATFYEPAHDSGHDPLTGWVTAPPSGRP
jgi:hypothetical protein